MAAPQPPQLSEADAKEILIVAIDKLKPYFDEGKELYELVQKVKAIDEDAKKQQVLIAGCMPIIQKELGAELAKKGFQPPMGVMMGMMQLKALGNTSPPIKTTMDAVQAAMMQGKLVELQAQIDTLLAGLKQ